MSKPAILLFALAAAGGCSRTLVLREPTPVVVTGQPPVRPAPIQVKIDRIVVTDAIHFDTNLDTIRADSTRTLDEVADLIKEHPELVKIRIEGHTDSIGKARDNLDLSKRRARAVRAYLVDRGVEPDRLIAEGYGGDNPVATNDTDEGRAKNRRVVFTILDRIDGDRVVEVQVNKDGAL